MPVLGVCVVTPCEWVGCCAEAACNWTRSSCGAWLLPLLLLMPLVSCWCCCCCWWWWWWSFLEPRACVQLCLTGWATLTTGILRGGRSLAFGPHWLMDGGRLTTSGPWHCRPCKPCCIWWPSNPKEPLERPEERWPFASCWGARPIGPWELSECDIPVRRRGLWLVAVASQWWASCHTWNIQINC